MHLILLLSLALLGAADAPPRACQCCAQCECPETFCECQKGSASKLCAKACVCLSLAAAPIPNQAAVLPARVVVWDVTKPAPNVYEWKALTNGDVQHLSLEKDGKPVGTYRITDGKYWDYSTGALVESKPPIGPPKDVPRAAPLRTFQAGAYYAPQWYAAPSGGPCPGGSCSRR